MAAWTLIFVTLVLAGNPNESSEGAVYPGGDTNGDARIDLADAIYLLRHLFRSGPAPVRYTCGPCDGCCPEAYRPLSTGVTRCIDPETRFLMEDCPEPGEPGYGQDATYQAGVSRRGQYVVVTLGEADNKLWITVDYATGLMWQYRATTLDFEGLQLGPFDDWRLPNFFELMTLVNFGRGEPTAYIEYFAWPEPRATSHWTSTPIADKTQSIFGRTDVIIGVGVADDVAMSVAEPSALEFVRAVRTLRPGDLELLSLK